MTDTVKSIFSDEDLEGLTILGEEDSLEYDEDDIQKLETQGNPRESKPLKWTADIYLSDTYDPGRTVVVRTRGVGGGAQLPSARPRKNETVTQAALRALQSVAGIQLASCDLLTRYISKIRNFEEGDYMRSTWVVSYDLSEFQTKDLDGTLYVDTGSITELIGESPLGRHYTNTVNVIAEM